MSSRQRLLEIARAFLKLGTISVGGPAAHIALMEDEFVARRRWVSRDTFLDLLGATNLIPGPNSTEMAISLGFIRGGWGGWFVAGAAFIVPAVLITAMCAWLYVRTGSLPQAMRWWFGISPAAIAVIALAVWRLMRTAVRSHRQAMIGVVVAMAALGGMSEIAALFLGSAIGMFWLRRAVPKAAGRVVTIVLLLLSGGAVAATAITTAGESVGLWNLGAVFLKVGSVLYGGGYVLVAFLEAALVRDRGWLTERQLLDAIAVGQFTPGPVVSTATFIGYVVAGLPGAIVATVGIFLPSFLFVAGLHAVLPGIRRGVWTAAFLEAANVAAIGLMIAVTIRSMNDTMRQRVWLVMVLVLGVLNLSQFLTHQTLRAELNKSRSDYAQLGKQIDERARRLVVDALRERRHDVIAAGYWLHGIYQGEEGLVRPQGLWIDGRPDFEGIGAWLFDVYLGERLLGSTDDAAKQKVLDSIKQSDEWRQKHP